MRYYVGSVGRNGRLEGGRGGGFRGWLDLLPVVLGVLEHERFPQHLVHVLDELDLDRLEDDRGNLPDVLLVFDRDEDLLDAAAMRGEDLLLETADREHVAPERHLARHREIVADCD